MTSFKLLRQRAGRISTSLALLLATAAPALLPDFAAAATVTSRSIALSDSTKAVGGVSYQVKFTSVGAAGAMVIDFCSDSPLLGDTCTPPTGFSVSSATTATSGFTRTVLDANTIEIDGTIAATTAITVDIDNVHNPTAAGPLYARIVTYTDNTGAAAYTSGTPGTHIDDGGVAISITNDIAVSAAVLESMTFCVSGAAITDNCVTTTTPSLKLGEVVGTVVALDATHVSTGDIYTQISTNAVGGAVVNLKSSTDCGGMKRVGASVCDIAPAQQTGITAGQAKFGVKTATATDLDGNSNGTYQPVAASGYSNSAYALNYVSGGASGVTSTYGDPFLDTNNGPVNGKNMTLTFGASIANNTPAGLYSTDLSLVATGKF